MNYLPKHQSVCFSLIYRTCRQREMKLIIFLIITLCFVLTSCNDDKDFWEVPLNGNNPTIECNVDGIAFEFCMLDENGNPSTKFREGENFSFYFKATNHREDELYYHHGFSWLYCSQELGDVKTLNNETIKYPYLLICPESLHTFPFFGEDKVVEMTIPWDLDPESEDYGSKVHIPKGKYYTGFTHEFKFVHTDHTPLLTIGPLTFKINFEVE